MLEVWILGTGCWSLIMENEMREWEARGCLTMCLAAPNGQDADPSSQNPVPRAQP